MKPYILIVFTFFSLNLFANPKDLNLYKNSNGQYNFFVEIPAGTKQKWEVNKDGILEYDIFVKNEYINRNILLHC